jgi:hypothetical protein
VDALEKSVADDDAAADMRTLRRENGTLHLRLRSAASEVCSASARVTFILCVCRVFVLLSRWCERS